MNIESVEDISYRLGIDIGSTTAKVAILDQRNSLRFSAYRRHRAQIVPTLLSILADARQSLGDLDLHLAVTGSAGLGIAEKQKLPFIQEVVASAEVVKQLYPQAQTLIDIGGEDAKMIFMGENGIPNIRMNGSCAGGTGAFIDEMASLLGVDVLELNELASSYTTRYPIASRCGVFAKTDVQNLLSREIPREDIAASIFHALVYQTITTLARGNELTPAYIFSGGPLTYLSELKAAFVDVLQLGEDDLIGAENTELLPAIGAALSAKTDNGVFAMAELMAQIQQPAQVQSEESVRLQPLFLDESDLEVWRADRFQRSTPRLGIEQAQGMECFLGVDSGSTTSKIVLIDGAGRLLFEYYENNNGNAIHAVQQGLNLLRDLFGQVERPPIIAKAMVTGYGEDLIKSAYGFDGGLVETLAHFRAARAFDEDVSFILDIGGQDMKAIFVNNGQIQNIEINEACSSGCGSFVQNFSRSMGYDVGEFASLACDAQQPCDMGSRCTVFMNSKVKQAQREAATIEDISAGLAYSVVKNALHKVLKVTDPSVLGDHIIVQGGTFRNPAIHRALEQLLGRSVFRPDIAELMGAYGAALSARDAYMSNGQTPSSFVGLAHIDAVADYRKRLIHCRGCENHCSVTKLTFQNENIFYTGNRCERIYSNRGDERVKGANLGSLKYQLLFDRKPAAVSPAMQQIIGIPRVLNFYENYPFWHALLTNCGFDVHLSSPSNSDVYEKGAGTVMSESICFPAKMAHGHIVDLIEAGVDRIFYPMVFYEASEFADSDNCYNCPIVSGYPDVVRSAIDPTGRYDIPLDTPTIAFNDPGLLKKACFKYLRGLGIKRKVIKQAFARAVEAQAVYKEQVRKAGADILDQARMEGREVVLLLGHPYHTDPKINHKIPEILAEFGVDVITEDAVPLDPDASVRNAHLLTQWAFINRYLYAAQWAAEQEDIEVVQLNSFGCAPDAISLDEVKQMLRAHGKGLTVLRIDEIESTGSAKLRLRSMVEAMRNGNGDESRPVEGRKKVKIFDVPDRDRKILTAHFSKFYSPAIIGAARDLGYRVEALPPPDRKSVELGLKYANNEVCYPCTLVVGDIIKALESGEHDLSDVAVASFMTGGQCRASCYTSLVKRALIASGHEDIPVVALTTNNSLHEQPGYNVKARDFINRGVTSLAFAGAVSDMYYATACREKHAGEAMALTDRLLASLTDSTFSRSRSTYLTALAEAVAAFNAIETIERPLPKVGIVGEVYARLNNFSNYDVAEWLMAQGFEVFMPTLLEYFLGWFVSPSVQIEENLRRPNLFWLLSKVLEPFVQRFINRSDQVMQNFRYYRPRHSIRDIAETAQQVMTLAHQYGESWLIAGEIGTMVDQGIENVLCLQPFGCIANQVVAKGISKRMVEEFDGLNLLFLDVDAGNSEVNFINRMHFFVDRARASAEAQNHADPSRS